MGITSFGLDDGFSLHETYAVLSHPSWVSSDAGALWINGSKQYGHWAEHLQIACDLQAPELDVVPSKFPQSQATWLFIARVTTSDGRCDQFVGEVQLQTNGWNWGGIMLQVGYSSTAITSPNAVDAPAENDQRTCHRNCAARVEQGIS